MFCESHPNLTLNHALYPSKGKRNPTILLPSLSAQSKETSCSLCLKYVRQFACKRLKMVYSFHHLNPRHLPSDRRMLLRNLQHSFYTVQWIIVDALLIKKCFLSYLFSFVLLCLLGIFLRKRFDIIFSLSFIFGCNFSSHFILYIYFWLGCCFPWWSPLQACGYLFSLQPNYVPILVLITCCNQCGDSWATKCSVR